MKEFEDLYTVEDIARMTMLTSRTIRNYLKDGMLTGRKIGGQWRFTKKDIENLFQDNKVEEEMKNNRRQDVMDFINGVNTDMGGELQLCTIADYYCTKMQLLDNLNMRFNKVISELNTTAQLRFYYEYIEKEQKARYTFLGTPAFIKAAAELLEEEWNNLNGSQLKFTGRAENYEKYRPSYPVPVIEHILSLSNKRSNVIAEIASGTGKLTRLLLDQNQVIYAIEPNSDMRREAEKKLGKNRNFHSLNKTADNTSLEADSMDLIVCAEAYHWFDQESTRMEFKRILKPEGYMVLLWNNFGENAYNDELWKLNERYAKKDTGNLHIISKEERAKHLFGEGNYRKAEYENKLCETFEGLLGGSLSASFAPQPGEEYYEEYKNGLKDIFDRYSKEGRIEVRFVTVCYYGKL